jgi:hypothetical protein
VKNKLNILTTQWEMINGLPHYAHIFPPCLIGGTRDELFACVGGPVGAYHAANFWTVGSKSSQRGRIKLGPLSAQEGVSRFMNIFRSAIQFAYMLF